MASEIAAAAELDPADDTRPPLSCYIRTLNEAHRVGPVITAALKVAREVVVVDSNSTDDTAAVARAHGARVIANPWPGNGHQKRVGEEACTHDWLLDLDADEEIDDQLCQSIAALFEHGEPPKPVYQVKMLMKPPGQPLWSNFMHTWRNKLYDRRVVRMPAHAIWDQLELPNGIDPPRVEGAIVHYAFDDFADLTKKYNSVSTRRAEHMKPRSTAQLALRIVFAFPFYFAKQYVLRGLFRAGVYGFAFAAVLAHARWLRDVKMYEKQLRLRAKDQSGRR